MSRGPVPACPDCHLQDSYRSHRQSWESLVPWLRAYRCNACGHRFLRFTASASAGLKSAEAPRRAGPAKHAVERS